MESFSKRYENHNILFTTICSKQMNNITFLGLFTAYAVLLFVIFCFSQVTVLITKGTQINSVATYTLWRHHK